MKHARSVSRGCKRLHHLAQGALVSLGLAWHGRIGLQTLWNTKYLVLTLIDFAAACTTACRRQAGSLSKETEVGAHPDTATLSGQGAGSGKSFEF